MIVARITDGLGNQLFQYAAARRLALHHGTSLKLDDCTHLSGVGRVFSLHHLQTGAQRATWADFARICPAELVRRLCRGRLPRKWDQALADHLARRGLQSPYRARTHSWTPGRNEPLLIGRVVSERHFHFDPQVLAAPDNVCMAGYWQDQRYFSDVAETLRHDLRPHAALVGLPEGEEHSPPHSVSLHLRRGDKSAHPHYRPTHPAYCRAAMDHCRRLLRHPVFFLFTDDWEWARHHFPESEDIHHVRHEGPAAEVRDLHLMSRCRHHIIAPSSFSWWAAWLHPRPDKLVISPPPQHWCQHPHFDGSGLLPSGWTILPEPW